jgi:hypothetical protein
LQRHFRALNFLVIDSGINGTLMILIREGYANLIHATKTLLRAFASDLLVCVCCLTMAARWPGMACVLISSDAKILFSWPRGTKDERNRFSPLRSETNLCVFRIASMQGRLIGTRVADVHGVEVSGGRSEIGERT